VLTQVREIVFFPIQLPELYRHLGISPPSGLLLHGPSGCGESLPARAEAHEIHDMCVNDREDNSCECYRWRVEPAILQGILVANNPEKQSHDMDMH
jgi:hypothetical protein